MCNTPTFLLSTVVHEGSFMMSLLCLDDFVHVFDLHGTFVLSVFYFQT